MAKYQLARGEVVVRQAGSIRRGDSTSGNYTDELVLTNWHLIWINKGAFGKVKRLGYFPLRDVTVYQGRAAVEPMKSGASWRLEVQFGSNRETFRIAGAGKKEVAAWADDIESMVVGARTERHSSAARALPGAAALANALKSTIDQFKEAAAPLVTQVQTAVASPVEAPTQAATPTPVPQTPAPTPTPVKRVAMDCTGCTAPVSGPSGQVAQCDYCGRHVSLP